MSDKDQDKAAPEENIEQESSETNELDELKQELAVEKEARLRTMADFQNYRKRMDAERATFGAIANMGLVQEIVEIYDDLQLAMNDEALDADNAKQAFKAAQAKLTTAALNAGAELVTVSVGDKFDSETMEAISTVEDSEMKDKVVAVVSSGIKYAQKEGILKAAKVVVGK